MSVFGDFQRVWVQRFPDSALPAAWEEDVRANLAKHKQKLALLKEELEKEEFYVEYLETLLSDVEKHKAKAQVHRTDQSPPSSVDSNSSDDKESDSKQNSLTKKGDSSSKSNTDLQQTEPNEIVNLRRKPLNKVADRNTTVNQCINELSDHLNETTGRRRCNSDATKQTNKSEDNNESVLPDSTSPTECRTPPAEQPASKLGGDFVTVIEVNGQKVVEGEQKKNGESSPVAVENGTSSQHEPPLPVAKKKVPPKPPPKLVSKRTSSVTEQHSDDSPTSSLSRRAESDALTESENECKTPIDDASSKISSESETSLEKRITDSANSSLEKLKEKRRTDSESSSLSKKMVESDCSSLTKRTEESESSSLGKQADSGISSSNKMRKDSIGKESRNGSFGRNIGDTETLPIGKVKAIGKKPVESGSRESLASITSSHDMPSITDRVKSYESLNSSSSEHKTFGKAGPQDSFESITGEDVNEEPYYDSVPNDFSDGGEYVYIQAGGARAANDRASRVLPSAPRAPDSPRASNYVNIHFLLQQGAGEALGEVESAPVAAIMRQDSTNSNVEPDRMTMHRYIIQSIIESETLYLECLYIMEKYMNAIKASLNSSQPVISEEEFNTIFYKIPELHELHKNFLDGLKASVANWEEPVSVGQHFKKMAENINMYGAFLHNYSRATDAVRKRSASSPRFADLTRHMKLKGQPVCLDDLLHKPVARVQKNALVLHDLIKNTPTSHSDHSTLTEALNMTQNFLDEFNIIQTKSMFPAADRAQRRLVKNSFIVELADGHRKLRHLFLFNDVIACAKYKASGRDKFSLELKWHLPLFDAAASDEDGIVAGPAPPAVLALRSQACTLRDQILAEDDKKVKIGGRSERQRKKLAELEGQLVLASPNLPFRVYSKSNPSRSHTFFLSSEYERTQWIDSIHALQASSVPPGGGPSPTPLELQSWVTACRPYLQADLGSVLLRSTRDDQLLLGDLQLLVAGLQAPLDCVADYYIVVEVDSYGHYFRRAKSKLVCRSNQPRWNETFVLELEGSQNLRLLLYEDGSRPLLRGKCTLKLSRDWTAEVCRSVQLGVANLDIRLRLLPPEQSLRRVPSSKPGAVFGAKLQNVCKREKRTIPFIVWATVREVERRGLSELGLYRVSGSASELARLRKSFETNAYEAEQLLKEVDIHSVTGVLKLYLRELPESLLPDSLQNELQNGSPMARVLPQLPEPARACLDLLLDHLLKVNSKESENKMSLHNLATVFGPTLLRPAGAFSRGKQDILAASTVDAMAQASLLYTMLQHRLLARQLAAHHACTE